MTPELARQINALSNQVVEDSLKQSRESFERFKTNIEREVEKMFNTRPMMEVTFNGGNPVTLSNRINPVLPRLMMNARLRVNTLLVGPAGCGKTTVAHQLSEALGLQFGSVCLTAGASEAWLFGRQTPVGFVEGMFSKIYREGGVFLADEMDAADANLLLSINTALSQNEMLNPMNGEVIRKHKDFVFIAAANTNGKGANHVYTGRSRLDGATLDRFVIITLDYDEELEKTLCPDTDIRNWLNYTREELKKGGYDEFVSTRAFQTSYAQYQAGITPLEIANSLVANWGDAAKSVALDQYNRVLNVKGRKGDSPYHKISLHMQMNPKGPFTWPE